MIYKTNYKKIIIFLISLLLLVSSAGCAQESTSRTGDYIGELDNSIQGGVILHAFCWSFNAIAENMEEIAKAGFTAVQTSPISECITTHPEVGQGMNIGGPNGIWWMHYQPVSYRIGNYQLGTEEEFAEMCKIAEEHGVKIIVDAVLNHFAADKNKISDDVKSIPGEVFRPSAALMGSSRQSVTQSQLLGLTDVNTQNPNVQQEALNYLKRCVELGASGFRYDAAYHIELPEDDPSFASEFWPVVLNNGSEFQYGEILNTGYAARYSQYMGVTDSTYGKKIASASRGGRFKANNISKYEVNTDSSLLVTWVESHDTFCNEGETADMTGQQILYGWAVLASRAGNTALFLSRPDGSSPGLDTRWGNNIIGTRGDDAFMSPEVSALNHFKRAMHGTDEALSNPTGNDRVLLIERGSGAVLINTGEKINIKDADVQLLEDGTYFDALSNKKFTVSGGKLSGTAAAESITVLYKQ